jgi:hypothetical protein
MSGDGHLKAVVLTGELSATDTCRRTRAAGL